MSNASPGALPYFMRLQKILLFQEFAQLKLSFEKFFKNDLTHEGDFLTPKHKFVRKALSLNVYQVLNC